MEIVSDRQERYYTNISYPITSYGEVAERGYDLPASSGVLCSASRRRMSSSYTSVDNSWNWSFVKRVSFSRADALAEGDSGDQLNA